MDLLQASVENPARALNAVLDKSFTRKGQYIGYDEGIDPSLFDRPEDLQFRVDPEDDILEFEF